MQQKQRHCGIDRAFGSAALAALLAVACGTESDLLTSRKGDGAGGAAGKNEAQASGGASGGSRAQPDSGAAGGQSGGAAAGNANGDNGISVDPNLEKKKALVEKLCSLLDAYPCLTFSEYGATGATGAAAIETCVDSERIAAADIPDGCFTAWAAAMTCLANTARQCPCSQNGCDLTFPEATTNPCPAENQAYLECRTRVPAPGNRGMTTGSVRTCEWETDPTGRCSPTCLSMPTTRPFGAECDRGVPGGPQNCICVLNGVPLPDGVTGGGWFYADDCKDAAQKMSDGQCDRILNCCFTWFPFPDDGRPASEQQCSCTSDPTMDGASTCQELATRGEGQVVTLCPQYLGQLPFPGP